MSPSLVLRPGAVTLAQWRAIHAGAGVSLDPAAAAAIARSAETVEAIVARGEAPNSISFDCPPSTRSCCARPRAVPGALADVVCACGSRVECTNSTM